MRRAGKQVALAVLTFAALGTAVRRAEAHGIGVAAAIQDGKVRVEAYFDDDTPAREARVKIVDSRGTLVGAGTTDDKGIWTAELPPPGTYRVTVDAGSGHRATSTFSVPLPRGPDDAPSGSAAPDVDARKEFTRIPWERLAIGLAALAAVGFLLPRFLRRSPSAVDPN